MWRIPLQAQVTDLDLHTLILNDPTGYESFYSLYTVPISAAVLEHIEMFNNYPERPAAEKSIRNVYKLPII